MREAAVVLAQATALSMIICNTKNVNTLLQQLEQQLSEQQAEQQSQLTTEPQKQLMQTAASQRLCGPAASESDTSADLPDQDFSAAEGAAGLLAMTSTADRSHTQARIHYLASALILPRLLWFFCVRMQMAGQVLIVVFPLPTAGLADP